MVLTNVAQNVSGVKTLITGGRFDCASIADGLRISGAAPTLDRGLGFLEKTLQYFDSSSIKNFLTAHLGVGGWVWNGRIVNDTVNKRVKLVGDDGNDPSATNPVWVCVPSTTAGKWFVGKITSAKGFDYQGAADSDIIGEEFGVTSGVAWGNDRPFAGYIVNRNDTDAGLEIAISPNPAAKESPATANIGYLDVPASTPSDNNFFFWTATNVTATHDAKPCFRFFSFRMTMNSSDDWAATTFDNGDGLDYIRSVNFGVREYDMPTGQKGATSGKYGKNNGGTFPTFTAVNVWKFKLTVFGRLFFELRLRNTAGGTLGAGAVDTIVTCPYSPVANDSNRFHRGLALLQGASLSNFGQWEITTNTSDMKFAFNSTVPTATTQVQNTHMNNAARTLECYGDYQAF